MHRVTMAEPAHRLHGTYGCFGDGLWIERVQGHLIPVTLPQINQCILLQVCLPLRLNLVFNAFYISSVATGCLSGCKWLFKDSLPSWQTHFASPGSCKELKPVKVPGNSISMQRWVNPIKSQADAPSLGADGGG